MRNVPDSPVRPHDYLNVDAMLSDEERAIRDTVRNFVEKNVAPNVAEWFEHGTVPRELMSDLGALGVLGMHLEGFGCAGTSATAYGLACMELEAGDSGIRSLVSVQGSHSFTVDEGNFLGLGVVDQRHIGSLNDVEAFIY